MRLYQYNDIPLYHFDIFNPHIKITHFITTRTGGVSKDHLSEFNLGFTVNDLRENVTKNRKRLAEALQIDPLQQVFAKQTSEDKIKIVEKKHLPHFIGDIHPELIGIDAMITETPGICIGILTADCVPVILYDIKKNIIAVIHSGWKGTVMKITGKCLDVMTETFKCHPENIIAGIGPSAGPLKYEVETDVINEVTKSFGENNHFLNYISNDKALLNLWDANSHQLAERGIPSKNIEISGLCSYTNNNSFFSARYTKGKTGRFATGIMIK